MILRLVKLHFKAEETADFLDYFKTIKSDIEAMPGLHELKLYTDNSNPNILFTHSIWESEQDLINYKSSKLFGVIWPNTKKRFKERPEAWSLTLN